MESLAQPPPPPGPLKSGGGGAAERLLPGEAAAGDGGGCRDGPAEEGGGRRSPSPPPAPAAPREASPPRGAESVGPTLPESTGAAPGSESGTAGAGSGSSGAASPPGEESRSLDSLESFSNLHSCCPSSSELNSDADEAVEAAPGGPAPQPDADRPAAGAQLLAASKERFPGQSVYHIKWVRWKEENTPVITQNENGPCPLLAIMNVLLLAWKVRRHRGAGGPGPAGRRPGHLRPCAAGRGLAAGRAAALRLTNGVLRAASVLLPCTDSLLSRIAIKIKV